MTIRRMTEANACGLADKDTAAELERLLALESKVCSHGDTVHYADEPQFFRNL